MQMKLPAQGTPSQTHAVSVAVARALIPSTPLLEGAGERTVIHTENFISRMLPEALGPWRAAHHMLDEAARLRTGRPLRALPQAKAEELIARWTTHPVLGRCIAGLSAIYKVTHFDLPDTRGSLRGALRTIQNVEHPRWESQIIRAEDYDDDEQIECDVVVVGTGAGGAVVGRHLADQGHAVVFVEEGEHVRRNEFPGNFRSTMEQVYRHAVSLGNSPMLIPQGRLVGGSTAVNTGTSFRPPRWVSDRWCEELGSDEFSADALAPYYDRVESILQVEPADTRYAGPIYDIFRRGAERLGWHSDTIHRNAPGCQGDGMCDNGCPTDARRSTLVAYLPGALERGNIVLSGLRAERILLEGGRAVGIEGVALDKAKRPVLEPSGREKRLRIKASAVILAGGAMATPQLLLQQGLANSSGQVGKNLTLHPSGPCLGLFDEIVDADKYIPQTAYSHEFLRDGLMLLSAHAEAHMMPATTGLVGQRLMRVFERSRHLTGMGFLLCDETRGRVHLDHRGRAVMRYNLGKREVAKIHRAQVLLTELLLAAGAKEVFPGIYPGITIFNRRGLEEFSRRTMRAGDFLLTSYHPLGTSKMSPDPKRGVVGLDHSAHDVPGLFIVDGSTVNGPLGVNPQLTVMALATRAAEKIGHVLE